MEEAHKLIEKIVLEKVTLRELLEQQKKEVEILDAIVREVWEQIDAYRARYGAMTFDGERGVNGALDALLEKMASLIDGEEK